jgi:hypothetical protein
MPNKRVKPAPCGRLDLGVAARPSAIYHNRKARI